MPSREELLDALEALAWGTADNPELYAMKILIRAGRARLTTGPRYERITPPPKPPTKRVHIAVAMPHEGLPQCEMVGAYGNAAAVRLLSDYIECPFDVHFVEAELPAPQPPQTIEGEVSS